MTFGDVAADATTLSERGFPVYDVLEAGIALREEKFKRWTSSGAVFMPQGAPLRVGELLVQKDLGRTLRRLAEAESKASRDRRAALLSKRRAAEWRSGMDEHRACPELPRKMPVGEPVGVGQPRANPTNAPLPPDTSYVCVVDEAGNVFSATPSDGFTEVPIVPGLGFVISPRGTQAWIDPTHPSSVQPDKRPRLTTNPFILFQDGRPVMPFGTPGADVQPSAMLQFVRNVVEFGRDPQAP